MQSMSVEIDSFVSLHASDEDQKFHCEDVLQHIALIGRGSSKASYPGRRIDSAILALPLPF